jgi:hypothetical protein
MQRLYAWVLPGYALAITFLVFFQGWPAHQQSSAETQRASANADVASKTSPAPAQAPAGGHENYPIPAPVKPPKHLFHLVFRYEGDGLIDQNAVEVCKSCGLVQANQEETKKPAEKPAPAKSAASNLFHFIVRYEGDGLIDNNVVEFFKAYLAAESAQQEEPKKSEGGSATVTAPDAKAVESKPAAIAPDPKASDTKP